MSRSKTFPRWIVFNLTFESFKTFTAGESTELCNVLIHSGEYIRMKTSAQLNFSCDVSSFERDPYEYIPKGIQFWEKTEKLERQNYKISNTIITTLLNVDAKVNHIYTCQTARPFDIEPLREITIGDQPAPVKNFSCVSHDFENWKCSFKAYERVPTIYAVAYKIANYVYDFSCVNTSFEDYVCEKELSRKTHRFYKFLLRSKNCFGKRMENFTLRILNNVVPRGLHCKLESVASTTAEVDCRIKTNYPEYYTEGFVLNVKYGAEDPRTWERLDRINTTRKSYKLRLTNLIPFNQYTVELQVRAASAKNSPKVFKYAKILFQTNAETPLLPPVTDPGAFFVDNNQCVHVFWRAVPDYKMNGTNFRYRVRIRSLQAFSQEEYVNTTTKYYYKDEICETGVYEYSLSCENSEGLSKEGKPFHVIVPTDDQRLELPAPYNIKTIYNDHLYKLEWQIPGLSSQLNLIDFTVSLCSSRVLVSSFEYCMDTIDFIHIAGNETKLTLPYDVDRQLIFAISANYRNGSSGMVMAHCIAHENSALLRLQPKINIFTDSTITIEWSLKCEEHALVTSYILQYCVLDVSTNSCMASLDNVTDIPSSSTNYTLSRLTPFTNYSLQMAMLSLIKQGPFSLPLRQQTAEGAPSAPIILRVSNITSKCADISWKVPTSPNGIIKYYLIFIDGHRSKQLNVEKEDKYFSYKLDNLVSYQNYTIQVAAVNVWNLMKLVGKLSEAIEFRTSVGAPGGVESPEIKIYDNFGRVSWDPPKETNGPIASIFYELKLCQNTECHFQSTKNTTTTIEFHCSEKDRITIFIRAIQEALRNDLSLDLMEKGHMDVGHYTSISKSCLSQHGRWMLIHDIHCHVNKLAFAYVGYVALLTLISFILCWKIYYRMKKITLVVPQGLHDILEPSNKDAALPDKPHEKGILLMQKQLSGAVKDNDSKTDICSQLLGSNKRTLPRTSLKCIPKKLDNNSSVINIKVKVKSDSYEQSFNSISIQMCSSASKIV